MAKVTKATREVVDVEKEIEKVTSTKGKNNAKKVDKSSKKENTKKSKKDNKKKKKGGILKFFKEVREEMSKVKWPSKKDMVKYSFATIAFVIFFGIFFYIIEIVMALLKAWV